jgi:hypothetical protein
MFDHAPFVHAFDEIALLVFVELLAEASSYLESFHRVEDASEWDDAVTETTMTPSALPRKTKRTPTGMLA